MLVTPAAIELPEIEADWIGIDAGFEVIEAHHKPCLLAIGDFDSLDEGARMPSESIILPVRKNETDTQAAIQQAKALGYQAIVVFGGLSKRLDHTLANLRCILFENPDVILMDEKQKVQVLQKGTYQFQPDYPHISFFAYEESCISLEGFDYPLAERKIGLSDFYTVSNTVAADLGTVKVHYGKVLCVQTSWK